MPNSLLLQLKKRRRKKKDKSKSGSDLNKRRQIMRCLADIGSGTIITILIRKAYGSLQLNY